MVLGNTLNILRPPDRSTPPIQTGWNEDLVKNMHDVLGRMQQQISATTTVSTASLTSYATKAILEAATVPAVVTAVQLTGYTAVGDGGGALYKRIGAEPSHALKIQSADGAWWEGVVSFMTPEMFGAVGDGTTDDLTKLQDMFDCTVSDTIMFGAGKTYFYQTNGSVDNLTINRAMSIFTNGSTLHHKMIGGSNNHALLIRTERNNLETWTETISAYATVFTITTSLAVGDRILMELGENATDTNVGDVSIWATITANSGTTITIDTVVPRDVNGTSHELWPVTPNEGTYIDVLRFVQEGSSAFTLDLDSVKDFYLGSLIVKDGTTALGIINGSENINIGSISGTGRDGGSSANTGRVLTAWSSQIIRIGTIDWVSNVHDGVGILLEAGVKDCRIGQLNLKRVLSQAATNPPVRIDGGSEIHIEKYTLTSNQTDSILDDAAGPNFIIIEELEVNATVATSGFKVVDRAEKFTFNGTHYKDKVQLYKRIILNENSTVVLDWFYGVPLRAYARIDDTANQAGIFVKLQDDTNLALGSLLTSGEWTNIRNSVNAEQALNEGTRFRLNASGKVGTTAVLDLWVEYLIDPAVTELSNMTPWDENRSEVTDTTNGSGDITIAHGLGINPRSVHVQMQGTTDYNTTVHTKGKTNFKVRVSDDAGAAVTSTAVTVSWRAGT